MRNNHSKMPAKIKRKTKQTLKGAIMIMKTIVPLRSLAQRQTRAVPILLIPR